MKKMKPIDKTVGQYSRGGREQTVPIWPTTYQQSKSNPPETEKTERITYRITFTFDWQMIGWLLFLIAMYLTWIS